MKDYIKPCLREENPDHIILHIGTNCLNSDSDSERIAKSIIDLSKGIKTDERSVSISAIVIRNDEWNSKASEVNGFLKSMCSNANIDFISHENINPKRHLNNSRLHLNTKGSSILQGNFLKYINNLNKS